LVELYNGIFDGVESFNSGSEEVP